MSVRIGPARPPNAERFEDITWTAFRRGDWLRESAADGVPRDEWDHFVNYATFMDQAWYQDGLLAWRNLAWRDDERFQRARTAAERQAGFDYRIDWRTHVALWASHLACRVGGDFMEIGTGRGWMAAAILEGVLGQDVTRRFFLVDMFKAAQVDPVTGERLDIKSPVYADGPEIVAPLRHAFSQVVVVEGDAGMTLPHLVRDVEQLAFVHFDLNAAESEATAFDIVHPRLVPGSVILIDDYGFRGFEDQQRRWDEIAARWDLNILAVPTGQGLIVV